MPFVIALLIVTVATAAPTEGVFVDPVEVFSCRFDEASDEDFDDWPDGWTRRRGPGFPHYVRVAIDRATEEGGENSLRIELDGGAAEVSSPPIKVAAQRGYVFEGRLRTAGLNFNQAFITLTLRDERGRVVRRYSGPRLGKTTDWQNVRIGPVDPMADEVASAVIGLHLEPTAAGEDLRGSASFADLRLWCLPGMSVELDRTPALYSPDDPIKVAVRVAGLRTAETALALVVEDATGARAAHESHPIVEWTPAADAKPPSEPVGNLDQALPPLALVWQPPRSALGFYRLRVELLAAEGGRLEQQVNFAVLDRTIQPTQGQFGWTLRPDETSLTPVALVALLRDAQVQCVKLPLWFDRAQPEAADDWGWLADTLASQGVTLVGLLDQPPASVREQLAPVGASLAAEVFTHDPNIWFPSLEPILIRHATRVRFWQLGDDHDRSFVGYPQLGEHLNAIRDQFDKVGEMFQLGVAWDSRAAIPDRAKLPLGFLSVDNLAPPIDAPTAEQAEVAAAADNLASASGALRRRLRAIGSGTDRGLQASAKALPARGEDRGRALLEPPAASTSAVSSEVSAADIQQRPRRWATLQLPSAELDTVDRANGLARQMVLARAAGAERLFVEGAFDARRGIVAPDGAPTELFIPWRTTTRLLGDLNYAGQLTLPGGSENRLFLKDDRAVVCVWNRRATREAKYLGPTLEHYDIWGRRLDVAESGGRQIIDVTSSPTFVAGLDAALARWELAVRVAPAQLESIAAKFSRHTITLANPFPDPLGGHVKLKGPPGWMFFPNEFDIQLAAGESREYGLRVMLPYDVDCGIKALNLDVELFTAPVRQFRVTRWLDVGLRDVTVSIETALDDQGQLEVRQRVENRTAAPVLLDCDLFARGRSRQSRQLEAPPRAVATTTYRFVDGETVVGEPLWLRVAEGGGTRVLNYRFVAQP